MTVPQRSQVSIGTSPLRNVVSTGTSPLRNVVGTATSPFRNVVTAATSPIRNIVNAATSPLRIPEDQILLSLQNENRQLQQRLADLATAPVQAVVDATTS